MSNDNGGGKLTFLRPASGTGKLVLGDSTDLPPPQKITGLVFSRPATGSGKLTFGKWTQGAVTTPDASVEIDADFEGEGLADVQLLQGAALALDADFADDMPGGGGLLWDANVSRVDCWIDLGQQWQQAVPVSAGAQDRWREADNVRVGTQARWQPAQPVAAAVRPVLREADRLRAAAVGHWQEGAPVRHADRQHWQDAERLRAAAGVLWQDGLRTRAALRQHWQDNIRLRHAARVHWQDAVPARASLHTSYGDGTPVHVSLLPHWQQAWRPRPGVSRLPPPPPGPPPCYDPARLGLLVFDTPYSGDGRLVFVCRRAGPGPVDPDPAQWVIPVLEVYVTTHSLSAVLLPGMEPVELLAASIESGDDGFGWSLQASGPEHLLDQLAPVGGLPARIRVSVDGHDWVFAVERIARTRRHGEHRASIQGRSVTALLGAPYMPAQAWLNTLQITAQQAVAQALQYTGTQLTWGIDDWTLPAGAWSYSGTPLQAALRVAEAAGAVLRSHATDERLILAPRYPALPWEWSAAAPTLQMPAAIITTDDLQPEPRAPYNAVYVSGMAGGVLGHVRRAGSAGDLLAPQVTDALITAEVAARMRGSSELAGAGNKLMQTMTLPMLTDTWSPGPVLPGWLVQVDDIGHTWRGLVRSIRINAGMPVVRQTIQVERAAP